MQKIPIDKEVQKASVTNLSGNEVSVKGMNVKVELPLALQTIYTRNEVLSMQSKENETNTMDANGKIGYYRKHPPSLLWTTLEVLYKMLSESDWKSRNFPKLL